MQEFSTRRGGECGKVGTSVEETLLAFPPPGEGGPAGPNEGKAPTP